MGLDFKFDPRGADDDKITMPHWSYCGFDEFRCHLASSIGIDLNSMEGFGGTRSWPLESDEPIIGLLDHSDWNGKIEAARCGKIAPRLREIVSAWKGSSGDRVGYDRDSALLLARAMEYAAEKGCDLIFY